MYTKVSVSEPHHFDGAGDVAACTVSGSEHDAQSKIALKKKMTQTQTFSYFVSFTFTVQYTNFHNTMTKK
jgi:hypothetical protein